MTAVWAHRGCTEGFVENTLEAFAEARRRGADGVELDVRLTADAALAIHHDAEIAGLGPICGLTVGELPAYVPLLAEVLAVCEGMLVNVEIKNAPQDPGHDPEEAVAALCAQIIDEAGWTDRVLVSSFQVSTLRAVQVADPHLAIGALWPILMPTEPLLAEAISSGYKAIHPFVTEINAELVTRAHAAGLGVNVWTVNARHDLEEFVALGVDAVITDALTEALAVARGATEA
ncbi:MAG TPA: glycerophosphodiester phosphodiesterase [Acidimicrobiales bacterium]|jgi:glycerophosphoryl diester phosphodiesterase